jgi:hypothetical protein
MAFEKRFASENIAPVDSGRGNVTQIFSKMGKGEASELEVRRVGKKLGLELTNLKDACDVSPEGLLRPKAWSED